MHRTNCKLEWPWSDYEPYMRGMMEERGRLFFDADACIYSRIVAVTSMYIYVDWPMQWECDNTVLKWLVPQICFGLIIEWELWHCHNVHCLAGSNTTMPWEYEVFLHHLRALFVMEAYRLRHRSHLTIGKGGVRKREVAPKWNSQIAKPRRGSNFPE